MLQLIDVRKSYATAGFTQVALDDVSVSFRDNEFVAVLGPSGSGKTTLLNIVGGLDHYDSGSLIIDGISTEKYRDRDWDSYRNNRIGFVFQSYNLIPHQSVLSNVELALTLSGVSRTERRQRAKTALAEVGLTEHVRKLPGQLSGGQMQRVAIARALINDPEILLADEPTGALDSTTSTQIMGLLAEIANDRLVIMVTHNPDLAREYATRTVSLSDGAVERDSNPYLPGPYPPEDGLSDDIPSDGDLLDGSLLDDSLPDGERARRSTRPVRRTSMSFLTAISLSFTNLMTKKGRTLMTSFAGSIGIIGIAAILALASGVNAYIKSVEEDTLSVYPLSIQSQGFDMSTLLAATVSDDPDEDNPGDGKDPGDGDRATGSAGANGSANPPETEGRAHEIQSLNRMFSSVGANDLASLKTFLDGGGDGIDAHVNSIQYSYNVTPQIFSTDTSGKVRQVNPDTSFSALGLGSDASSNGIVAASMSTNVFAELTDDTRLVEAQYDVSSGRWPSRYDEVVVVLRPGGGISDFMLYAMGLRDPAELDAMVAQMVNDEQIITPTETKSFSFSELMAVSFKVVNPSDYYVFDATYDVWKDSRGDQAFLQNLVTAGEDLRIVGVVQPREGASATALSPGIYYTPELTRHLIGQAAESQIVQRQLAEPEVNVFSGRSFADEEENPARGDVDFSSLVEVDSEALKDAFAFDSSKLNLDLSGLNLSMPDLKFDPTAMPELDLTALLASVDVEELVAGIDLDGIIADLDLSKVVEGVDLSDSGPEATAVATALLQGYLEYCVAGGLDPAEVTANFPLFLDSESGQAVLDANQTTLEALQTQLSEQATPVLAGLVTTIGEAVQKQITANAATIQTQIQTGLAGYLQKLMATYSTQLSSQLSKALATQLGGALKETMDQLTANMSDAMGIDQDVFADAFQFNTDPEELAQLLASMMTTQSSYDGNLAKLGYADFAKPSEIDIYPVDFEGKSQVIAILDGYNQRMADAGSDDKVITYTDIVGTLMSSVTDIVNVISYVLTAFVAISLVVSSIMIGVITYISVLERKKEIGILRAIGAAKRDIRRVFNAETLIVGFVAGLLGIAVTVLLTIPANAIVLNEFGVANVAQLPALAAVVLVLVSMGLTFIAGLIPSSAASRRDPVEALRSE